jgi:hypothetical protein
MNVILYLLFLGQSQVTGGFAFLLAVDSREPTAAHVFSSQQVWSAGKAGDLQSRPRLTYVVSMALASVSRGGGGPLQMGGDASGGSEY